jgi:hypothetical protein
VFGHICIWVHYHMHKLAHIYSSSFVFSLLPPSLPPSPPQGGDDDDDPIDVVSGTAEASAHPSQGATRHNVVLWAKDEQARLCKDCGLKFHFFRRRHHCRACGQVASIFFFFPPFCSRVIPRNHPFDIHAWCRYFVMTAQRRVSSCPPLDTIATRG